MPDTGDAAWQSRDDAVHLATARWVVTFAGDSCTPTTSGCGTSAVARRWQPCGKWRADLSGYRIG